MTKIQTRICADCQREFRARWATRCPECARRHKRKLERVADWRERRAAGDTERKAGRRAEDYIGAYQIIHDPDESWGYQTHLDLAEIKVLLERGHLAPGTRFRKRTTGEIFVVSKNWKFYRLGTAGD